MKRQPTPLIRLTESAEGGRKIHVSRSFLEQIVKEELAEALREADDDEEKTPEVDDASKDKKPKKKAADRDDWDARLAGPGYGKHDKNPDPVSKDKTGFELDGGADDDQEVSDTEDPADDEVESDVDDEEGGGDEKLSDELVGKTIQSVTMEPKSKLVPGAQELVITFNEIADPLKIIVTKSGEVRFFFRGGLHNLI